MNEYRQIFGAELFSVIGGVLAGTLLAIFTDRLELLPGILILLPGYLEAMNSIYGSLSARLGSSLHMGNLEPTFKKKQSVLTANIFTVIFLTLGASAFLGLVAIAANYIIFRVLTLSLFFVPVIASLVSIVVLLPTTTISSFFLFKQGLDPDNVMGPIVTTTGDIFNVIALLIAIVVIV